MTFTVRELLRYGVTDEVAAYRRWRVVHHVRLYEFAAMAGISHEHWQRVETGRVPLRDRTRAKADALLARWSGHGGRT